MYSVELDFLFEVIRIDSVELELFLKCYKMVVNSMNNFMH